MFFAVPGQHHPPNAIRTEGDIVNIRTRVFQWRRDALGVLAVLAASFASATTAQTAEEFRGNLDDTTSPAYCGQCHTRIYSEWQGSIMAKDLTNPIVCEFYTSTNKTGKFDGLGFEGFNRAMGHGGEAGDCADCHVPRQVIEAHERGEEVDLGEAMDNVADHGIACSFCHAVSDVKLEKDENGRYAERIYDVVTLEPNPDAWHRPFDTDEAPHDVVQSDIYRSSEICGACHLNQEKLLSISTCDDWKQSYGSGLTDQTCQGCHMPLIEGAVEAADGGPERKGMRRHTSVGSRDAAMRARRLVPRGPGPVCLVREPEGAWRVPSCPRRSRLAVHGDIDKMGEPVAERAGEPAEPAAMVAPRPWPRCRMPWRSWSGSS